MFGYKSVKELTGVELYAINPFALTKKFTEKTEFQDAVNAGIPLETLQADTMTHTLPHEYAHMRARGHDEHFTIEFRGPYNK